MKCPFCEKHPEMKRNEHGVFECPACGAVFAEQNTIKSIFGVHR